MPLQQGARLGHYRITGRVGAGGMGEVYRAHDENLGRDVALKVLTDQLVGSAELQERFEREARAVAALSHPNILVIHDFGREGATAYAVAELLEGKTLRQRLEAQGPLPPREAAAIARDIARGLAAAHEKRIVHRDIKPENVFLTAGGAVKILDFGLARSHEAPADPLAETLTAGAARDDLARGGAGIQLTTPGDLLGTASYMSPEQVRGQLATPRSDVFALGCVLHEMLSGRSPFARTSRADTFAAILEAEAPVVGGSGTKLPRSVGTVLTKCLTKDAGARYEDASPLLADLDAVCREIAGPPAIEARSIVASLRRPAIAIPVLLVATAMAFGIYRWNERRARETWARQTAIPEAQRLVGENSSFEAYELALAARAVVGADPALEALWGTNAFVPREVAAFLIDRTEVTNAAYREFVGAGGYSNAEHWREPFERDGETPPTAEAMAAFRDSTGRPGPAAWLLGAPPDRTDLRPTSMPPRSRSWASASAPCWSPTCWPSSPG